MTEARKPKAKILWLEDDREGFEIALARLAREGFEVSFVSSVKDFNREIKKGEFDLIIVDIRGDTFNGLDVIRAKRKDFGRAKVCVLSGYLDEKPIQEVLLGIDYEVFVLDKSYPFDDGLVEIGLEAQITRIISDERVHTNHTYFAEVDTDRFEGSRTAVTYEMYNQMNPSEKEFVKNYLLDMADAEIQKASSLGFKWFLVCGPNGRILRKSKNVQEFSSDMVSMTSLAEGYPCVVSVVLGKNEEIRSIKCNGMYGYYYSVTISFSGLSDSKHDIHFDSGSHSSWFDLHFLRSVGIGRTGDMNLNARLQTTSGIKRVYYYGEPRDIAIYDQDDNENMELTRVMINGLPDWEKHSFSGFTDAEVELCASCRPFKRCRARVGLLGSDLLREPKPIKLIIDGGTGKTSVKGSSRDDV